MKSLRLLAALAVAVLLAPSTAVLADSFDSDMATVQKSSDKTAKVMIDKGTYMTPISFEDGASWDVVKDHYELDPAAASGVKSGTMAISVGADGTLTFKPTPKMSSKKK